MLSERAQFCCMIVSIFVIVGLLTESRRSDSCKDERALRPTGRVFFAARLGHQNMKGTDIICLDFFFTPPFNPREFPEQKVLIDLGPEPEVEKAAERLTHNTLSLAGGVHWKLSYSVNSSASPRGHTLAHHHQPRIRQSVALSFFSRFY